jgi:hypothetical protein
MSDDSDTNDRRRQKLEAGKSVAWIFRDWKKRREVKHIYFTNLLLTKKKQ